MGCLHWRIKKSTAFGGLKMYDIRVPNNIPFSLRSSNSDSLSSSLPVTLGEKKRFKQTLFSTKVTWVRLQFASDRCLGQCQWVWWRDSASIIWRRSQSPPAHWTRAIYLNTTTSQRTLKHCIHSITVAEFPFSTTKYCVVWYDCLKQSSIRYSIFDSIFDCIRFS